MKNNILTIPHVLESNSQNYPDEIAMREKKFGIWKIKSWLEVSKEIERVAIALDNKGVKAKNAIGIIGNNTPRWVIAEIASQSLGGIALGLYADALESEIEYLLDLTSCEVVFVEDEEQADKILSLNNLKNQIKLIIYDEEKGMNKYNDKRLISYKKLLDIGNSLIKKNSQKYSDLLNNLSEDDICIFCPTSGTTSKPKLAMISHKNLLNHAKNYLEADPKSSADEYVSVLPLPWIMEQTFAISKWCLSRMKVNFVEEPETMFDDLREIGPTFLLLGPRSWEQIAADIRSKVMDSSFIKRKLFDFFSMLKSKNNSFIVSVLCENFLFRSLKDQIGFSFLKSAATGGAALGPDTFKFFVNMGIPLRQLYGQTEQLGAYTIHRENDVNYESVGIPFNGVKVDIFEPDTEGLGEIIVMNKNCMNGYFGTKVANSNTSNNKWFHTGDAGYFDKSKHLVVVDRVSDLSYTSEKVRYSPQYLENKLKFSPFIAEAAVIGSNKPYLSSIICIRYSVLSKWAELKRVAFTTYSDLASKPDIEELLISEVKKVNKSVPKKQIIKKFVLLYKEFDADDDELTRTKKLRRNYVINKYDEIVEAIYSEKKNIRIDTLINLQDGGKQRIKTELNIINME
ncbi:MAG: Long-chain-fatty-acid--CoA ligase FadD15 [Alphaproteobacteria bacterium MarineAlpha9_Bin4]|nr:long-chain fatty acid--CoA ligase [Pelagibacterales bacterium]PPR26831.1 MAG: Long-chain-fatty-acid--CoA ligase FadD15 [Alphaproteobacteria bacterium MarineAlpha9_Bin4]|tara:strand:- start:4746 stop:6623 length:1878 start_codon:yes stop_codon:yes gene_type:complete